MGIVHRTRFLAVVGAVIFTVGCLSTARAQDVDADDLKRGVARISVINGEVSVRRGDSGDWVAAVVNAPLMTADRISTGPNSRAEVQFDAANVLRIGGSAEVHFTQLEYGRYQMEITHGTVTFAVLRPSGINVEVDTPSVSVRPTNQGIYRISVDEAGETQVMARSGQVEVFTPRGSQWVSAGQMMMVRGPGADAEFQMVAAPPIDEWDRWNQSRDAEVTRARSNQYVPEGVYGVEELDNHGTWVNADDYGMSWRPNVGPDWSPYSLGRWGWQDWYGWSWTSYDPWGWAPYHYGRWFNSPRYGWCWYPGAFGRRQYWSPALVGFIGFGRGGGFGFGFGNVGWVPLAPYERYNRWWGRGYYGRGGFNQNINITNININNTYRNARVRNGIMGVGEGDFRGGRFNNVRRYSGDQIREAGQIRGQMPIAPGNEHLRYSDREARHIPRNNRTANTAVFRRQQPNPVERVSFAQQQRAIEPGRFGQNRGDRGGVQNTRPDGFQGNRNPAGQDGSARQFGQNQGDRSPQQGRFQQEAGNNGGFQGDRGGLNQNARPQRQQPNGWRRFGEPAGQNPGGAASPRGMRSEPGSNTRPERQIENTRPDAAVRTQQAPANRGSWQRFGEPGNASRPQVDQRQRGFDGNSGSGNPSRIASPSGNDPRSLRIAPQVVRERENQSPRGDSGRQFDSGGESAPRSFVDRGSPRGMQSAPRQQFDAPRQQDAPRFNGGGEPRGFGGGGMSAPRQQSAPQFNRGGESRGFGGGGMSAPRQQSAPQFNRGGESRGFGGGGMSSPRQQSAPRFNGGGGGSPRGAFGGGVSPRQSGGGSGGQRQSGGGGSPRGRR